jgi:TRAP transporter TAXI family solute receptor
MNQLFKILFTTITLSFFCLTSNSISAEYFTIGSGPSNKINFVLGNAICKMMGKLSSEEHGTGNNSKSYRCTSPSTGSASFNLDQVQEENFQFSFVRSDKINSIVTDQTSETIKPFKEIRSVFSTSPYIFQIVTNKKSAIKDWKSLKGKKVHIGKEDSVERKIFELLMDANKINKRFFGAALEDDSVFKADTFCKNKLDAVGLVSTVPNLEIEKAVTKCGASVLDLKDSNLDYIIKNNSYFSLIEISKDTYKNKEQIKSVSFVDNLITHSNVPEDTVYHLVKAVFENFSDFQKEHEAFAKLSIQQMIKQGIAAPLHPGAIKYYKEKGWM